MDQIPSFRKIGNTVYIEGTLHFTDGGKFADDQRLLTVPDGMLPSSKHNDYECNFSLAYHNGSGTMGRFYIKKDGGLYIVGTNGATNCIVGAHSYIVD